MDIEKVKKYLESIIRNSLSAPPSDPSDDQLNAAADAYRALKEIDPDYYNPDTYRELKGSNLYEEDFLEEFTDPIPPDEEEEE